MKEFVLYDEVLELKDLGFDEPCLGYYAADILCTGQPREIQLDEDGNYKKSKTESFPIIVAPTYSQAFRWFREKYRLKGEIDTADMIWSKWSFNIELKGSSYILYSGLTEKIYFNSYEEAELECLKKLIEIVKEKQL